MIACAVLLIPSLDVAVEMVPATARDIVSALGPDARGLAIYQDDLPDLFTLTSSRIDENATRFFVEQAYTDGRWKDGKAVIEYARDLSYTLVSVYDKQGKRQRIYSVKTQYGEHMARSRSQVPDLERGDEEESGDEVRSTRASRSDTRKASEGDGGAGYEWDDAKGDYVYKGPARSETTQVAAGTEEQSESVSRAEPRRSTKRASKQRRYRRVSDETAEASGDVWLPTDGKSGVKKTAKGAVVAVGGTTWVERKEVRSVDDTPPPPKRTKSAEVRQEIVKAEPPPPPPPSSAEKVVDVDAQVPVHEPPKLTRKERREQVRKEKEAKKEEERREEARKDEARKEETARRPETKPAERYSRAAEAPALEVAGGPSEEQVPSTEELLADEPKAGKPAKEVKNLTADGDAWVPKSVKSAPDSEAEIQARVAAAQKVAMVPKKAPVDNSVEALLRMSEKNNVNVSKDADAWVPKAGAVTPGTEAVLSKEIQRAREEEKQRTMVVKKAPIRKDVNNPEEGVLPVSSFEKMSGPMFGRHREYERRFYPGKLTKSKAPVHDFYVDEVDRKKEFHNIYFYQYQKGKPPKLVAVQRHEKVSFRSNYDIDKEDSGKLSTYN